MNCHHIHYQTILGFISRPVPLFCENSRTKTWSDQDTHHLLHHGHQSLKSSYQTVWTFFLSGLSPTSHTKRKAVIWDERDSEAAAAAASSGQSVSLRWSLTIFQTLKWPSCWMHQWINMCCENRSFSLWTSVLESERFTIYRNVEDVVGFSHHICLGGGFPGACV